MNNYKIAKGNNDNASRFNLGAELDSWITLARLANVIQPTEKIIRKFEKCKEENNILNENMNKIVEENNALYKKLEKTEKDLAECKKALNDWFKTQKGDEDNALKSN